MPRQKSTKRKPTIRDDVSGERNIDLFGPRYRLRIKQPGGDEIREMFDTLEAARKRRDELRVKVPDTLLHRFRSTPMNTKASYGRVGVSRTEKVDNRRPGAPRYVVFAVNWIDDDGTQRVTGFQAGKSATASKAALRRAELTAVAFREAYEYSRIHGWRFQPGYFVNWRSLLCYPFAPPDAKATAAAARAVPVTDDRKVAGPANAPTAVVQVALDDAETRSSETDGTALSRVIDETEVTRLCEHRRELGQFRAVMLIARLRTGERAIAFLSGTPTEQERLWAPATPES